MARKIIKTTNIFGGHAPSFHFSEKGQFLDSIAIDPDVPLTDSSTDIHTAGVIRPVAYEKFSGATMDQKPLWITTNPKDAKIYVYGNGGDIYSYNSSLASETLVRAVSSSSGNGLAYYNNYLYYARNADIGRYGPLDGTPAATDTFWTSTLSLTAPTNTTYPTTRHSLGYPNHAMHVHVDNKLYHCDVVNGQGIVSFVLTKKGTDEGDTDNGSTYNALDLPFGYLPFDIESYGNLLVIAASQTTNSVLNQGSSALFFWDTTSPSFSLMVRIPDPLCTALKYQNGILYGWSGSANGGVRFFKYVGGQSIQTIKYKSEGHPPMAGAVAGVANRISWGTFTTTPANSASVLAYGSKSDLFPRGLHNIARSTVTATASNGLITALNFAESDNRFPKMIIGATDGTNNHLDKLSTTYQTSVFRTEVFNINKSFSVENIRLRLGQAVGANMTVVPKLYFDNETSSQAGTTINSTNYPDSNLFITQTKDNFSNNTSGKNNFFLELTFSGTALITVLPDIEFEIEESDNAQL